MAQFFGTVQGGGKKEQTATGTAASGLVTNAASAQGSVQVRLTHDKATGLDVARVSLEPWEGAGASRVLYDGPVGDSRAEPGKRRSLPTAAALVDRAERLQEEFNRRQAEQLGALADERLALMAAEFRKHYPKRRLRILFGMGSYYVDLDGRPVQFWQREDFSGWEVRRGDWYAQWEGKLGHALNLPLPTTPGLALIHDALGDVERICGDFTLAAPNDLTVTPEAK